jgi:hypothetical protein
LVDQHEPSGVLVISVWLEPEAEAAFRARLTVERDLDARRRGTVVVSEVPALLDHVEAWVRDVAEASSV